MSDWIPCSDRLPAEDVIVEVAVIGAYGRPYRAFGCRTDGGLGWLWALNSRTMFGEIDPRDCEADDDYDVYAWREPSPLPQVPTARRFRITSDRGEGVIEDVGIVTDRDVAQRLIDQVGETGRWEELPPLPTPPTAGSEGT